MLVKISRIFIYAALVTPIFLNRSLFFPFISGKQIFFRVCVEAALGFFLLHLAVILFNRNSTRIKTTLAGLKHHLSHPIIICLAIFAFGFVISTLFSQSPTAAFWSNYERGDGAFQILHYVLFAILIKILFTEERLLARLIITNIVVSIPVCFYALAQMLADPSNTTILSAGSRVSGTLGNPSYLAGYLIFNICFMVYFLLRSKDTLVQIGLGLLTALQIFLIIKAQTIGAALGIFIGLVVFAIHLALTTKDKRIKKIGLYVGGAAVAFTLIFFATRSAPFWQKVPLFERITNISQAYENLKPRLWAWNSAVSGFKEKPIIGWGLENFPYAFDKYYDARHFGRESFFDRTHNLFLEYLIGGGLLSFIPWLLVFFFYYRGLRKRPTSIWKSILVAMPAIYLVQGFVLFDVLSIYLPLFLLLIFVVSTNDPQKHEPQITGRENLKFSGLNYLSTGLISIAILTLIYTTSYLPLRRNQLIITALGGAAGLMNEVSNRNDGKLTKTPAEVIELFHNAIDYRSPVGRSEAIEMYQKFVLDLLTAVSQIPDITKNENAKRDTEMILADVNDYVDQNENLTPGVKTLFINAGLNIKMGVLFKMPKNIERGRKISEEKLAIAPNRIELINLLIQLAQDTNDKVLLSKWAPIAVSLRPDLYKITPATTTSIR